MQKRSFCYNIRVQIIMLRSTCWSQQDEHMNNSNISQHYLHQLPAQMNATIGRAQEIASAISLLSQENTRLLTLTGPGGVGKTRLALEIAKELLPDFKDGVFFVPLAPLREPGLVLV